VPIAITSSSVTQANGDIATTLTLDCSAVQRTVWSLTAERRMLPWQDPSRPTSSIASAVIGGREDPLGSTTGKNTGVYVEVPGAAYAPAVNAFVGTFTRARGLTEFHTVTSGGQLLGYYPIIETYTIKMTHPLFCPTGSGYYVPLDNNARQALNNIGLRNILGFQHESSFSPYATLNRFVRPINPSEHAATTYRQPYRAPRWTQAMPNRIQGWATDNPPFLHAAFTAGSGTSRLFSDGLGLYWQNGVQRTSAWGAQFGPAGAGGNVFNLPLIGGLPAYGSLLLSGAGNTASWSTEPNPANITVNFYGARGAFISAVTVPSPPPTLFSTYTGGGYNQPHYSFWCPVDLRSVSIPAGALSFNLVTTPGLGGNGLYGPVGRITPIDLQWSSMYESNTYPSSTYTYSSWRNKVIAMGGYPSPIPGIDLENPNNWQPGILFDV